jgi:hypothetical protein
MTHRLGERESGGLRLDFGRRLKLEFHASKVTSDAGLLPFRELDEALGLTEIAGDRLVDPRTGKNGLIHFEGISGRQIRKAGRKHSNRASSYRNYTCQLLAIFAQFIQNSLGSEPPQGCRLRDKQRCMGAIAPTRSAQPTLPPRTTRKLGWSR